MDIDLLSKMVGELVLEHDSVSLPGLGTFVAAEVPASFSDKGFTINPPYRKLSFIPSETSDDLLVRLYAERNSVDEHMAKAVLTHFLSEMKEALKSRKTLYLVGLGRLRATLDNNFFFVPNPDLDIYPEGFGLCPVSLKNTAESFLNLPLETAVVPKLEPDAVATIDSNPISPASRETVLEPDAVATIDSDSIGPSSMEPEASQPVTVSKPASGSRWWIWPVAIAASATLALGVFVLLAHIAPDFIDSLLYTPEELRIINY